MRYIYHYHAMRQSSNGDMQHIDGIADMQFPVLTMGDYEEMKKEIAAMAGIADGSGIIICSLSLIRETDKL